MQIPCVCSIHTHPLHFASRELLLISHQECLLHYFSQNIQWLSILLRMKVICPWHRESYLTFHQGYSSHLLFFHSLLFLLSTNHTELLVSQINQLVPNLVFLKLSSLQLDYSSIKYSHGSSLTSCMPLLKYCFLRECLCLTIPSKISPSRITFCP